MGMLVYAPAMNVEGHHLSKLRHRLAGTATGVGESRFVFASVCFEWSCRDGMFDVYEPAVCGGRERELKRDWYQNGIAQQEGSPHWFQNGDN